MVRTAVLLGAVSCYLSLFSLKKATRTSSPAVIAMSSNLTVAPLLPELSKIRSRSQQAVNPCTQSCQGYWTVMCVVGSGLRAEGLWDHWSSSGGTQGGGGADTCVAGSERGCLW